MAKWANDRILEAAAERLVSEANLVVATAGQPANYSAAFSGRLAEAAISGADWSITSGTGSRRASFAGKDGTAIAAGTANHVCFLDTANSRLLFITTCPNTGIPPSGTVTFGAVNVAEVAQPV